VIHFISAVGRDSLYSNTTGNSNSAVGRASLHSNTTGYSNSAIGYNAGRYITGGSTANETSNTSIYLGADTKALASGDSNEIVIGYDTTGLGSNTAVLGNSSITKTANVGIGTDSPNEQLEITKNFRLANQETADDSLNGIIYKGVLILLFIISDTQQVIQQDLLVIIYL